VKQRLTAMLALAGTLLTLLFALFWFFPLYWMLVTSLKEETQTIAQVPTWIPQPFDFTAYIYVLTNSPILRWYVNSAVTSLLITFFVLLFAMLCAFAVSQLEFPGKKWFFWFVLAGFMIPFQASIIPLFMFMNRLGLVNSYAGVVLPQLAAPVAVVIYKQFFDQVPREIGDAARIDGASEFQVLFGMYLPLNWGITRALAIITFISAWNNFFWPFLIMSATPMLTIPVGITQVQSSYGVAYAKSMATAVLAALPTVAAYLIFQRRVTEGVMATVGLK
jgi:multiple sugar transport system permease protein